MARKRIALVTGVSEFWGSRVAAALLDQPGYHVIGLDNEPPKAEIKGLDFVRADIRNPLLVDLLKSERVEIVCHLQFIEGSRLSESAFDHNVMGTSKALAACAEAGVRKIVLRSSTAVYGARPDNPAFLTEEHTLKGSLAYGLTRDLMEIEAFCNGFRRQSPQTALTILRFASVVGSTVKTPLTRFLSNPLAPVLWGFDPMMQVIHEEDAVAALVHAVEQDAPGVFNVAAEGVLPLSRVMGLAGKLPLPVFHLLAYWGAAALGSGGMPATRFAPMELDSIRYPWVADLKKMRETLRFTPRYSAVDTLQEFAARQRVRLYTPEAAARNYDEERLRGTIERRRRARQQDDPTALEESEP
jgi:UDP-glucose 4-epimerase